MSRAHCNRPSLFETSSFSNNHMQKGLGYHLDMLVVAVLVLICSLFGLPFLMASTVPSIAHVMSLRVESKTRAPGEKPRIVGARENRMTALAIAVATGLSLLPFVTQVLNRIPMPVLYGVFLYMVYNCVCGNLYMIT